MSSLPCVSKAASSAPKIRAKILSEGCFAVFQEWPGSKARKTPKGISVDIFKEFSVASTLCCTGKPDRARFPSAYAENLHGIQANDDFPFQFDIVSYQNGYAVVSVSAEPDMMFELSLSLYDESASKEDRVVPVENDTFTLEVDKDYLFSISVKYNTTITAYCGIMLADFFMSSATVSDVAIRIRDVEVNEINQFALTNHNPSEMWTSDGIPFPEDSETGLLSAGTRYEIEPNDTRLQATRIYDDEDVYGYISSRSDADWFVVSFTSAGNANFWLGNIPAGCDYDLFLYASDGSTQLASSRGTGTSELITYEVRAYTNYYLKVNSHSGESTINYWLRAKNYPYAPPVSGDQYEPNDNRMAATPVAANSSTQATIHIPNDIDFFRFSITETSSVSIQLSSIPFSCDYNLELYDSAGVLVGLSALGSNINEYMAVTLPAGTYYPKVYSYSGSSTQPYWLHVSSSSAQTYITYVGNFNSAGTVPARQAYTPGVPVTIANNAGALQRTGFRFIGWNTNANGTGTDYFPGQSVIFTSVQPILWAKWEGTGADYWPGGFASASNLTFNYIADDAYANTYIIPAVNSWNNKVSQVNITRSGVNPKITFYKDPSAESGVYGMMKPYALNDDGTEYCILDHWSNPGNFSWSRCEILIYDTKTILDGFSDAERISNIAHEIGHALSLPHPTGHNDDSIMRTGPQSIPPQNADIINLRTKWGQ